MTPTSKRVLVVGGGPAGSTAAYWLSKAGFHVTVAERSSNKFAYGQGIDITGPAIPIVEKMGLLEKIRSMTTGEGGFAILDDDSRTIASVGAGDGLSLTQEIEIMRGDLTKILADAADASENVTYRFGCTVSEIRQSEDHVTVVLSDGDGRTEDFSAIIGADGLMSKVRRLIMEPDDVKNSYKSLEQYCAYFSMDGAPEDVPNSRLQHAPGRRVVLVRPVQVNSSKRSSCYMVLSKTTSRMAGVLRGPVEDQKAAMADAFKDFPGLVGKRALEGMWEAKDFYLSETAQIRLPRWSNGRCVLVGDAASAASPISGQGTVLAILAGYLVAGEMALNPGDPRAAFEKYEERLRPFVKKAQNIPTWVPKLANPETYFGIRIFRFVFWLVAWSGVWKLFNIKGGNGFDLPEYDFGG